MSKKITSLQSLILFLTLFTLAVSGDMSLPEIVCRETDLPDLCLKCVSELGGDTSSEQGIAATVIKCIKAKGSSLGAIMAGIARRIKDPEGKRVFGACHKSYAESCKALDVASEKLTSKDYDTAEKAVTTTLYRQDGCLAEINYYKKHTLSAEIQFKLKIFDGLIQIADRIIERLP